MGSVRVSGTEGYAEEAAVLFKQYESISFAGVHRQVLHLIPIVPCRVLDIGSGTGRDAPAFAALRHRVVAVEPTAELRNKAAALHPSPQIEWLDDSLPALRCLTERGETFQVVMLTAVWMHLDQRQRQEAMPRIACLLPASGLMILTLRHGPVPPGRRMFDVSAAETTQLAETAGLSLILQLERQAGSFGRPDVSWTRLAFAKRDNAH